MIRNVMLSLSLLLVPVSSAFGQKFTNASMVKNGRIFVSAEGIFIFTQGGSMAKLATNIAEPCMKLALYAAANPNGPSLALRGQSTPGPNVLSAGKFDVENCELIWPGAPQD